MAEYKYSLITLIIFAFLNVAFGVEAYAQRVTNASYSTIGHIRKDGTVQDASFRTIGHIRDDGTIQDGSYRTIGHAEGIPKAWAAWYFFF